jgi:hypothetical protein
MILVEHVGEMNSGWKKTFNRIAVFRLRWQIIRLEKKDIGEEIRSRKTTPQIRVEIRNVTSVLKGGGGTVILVFTLLKSGQNTFF